MGPENRTIFAGESSASLGRSHGPVGGAEQRLAFLEARLFWLGTINRVDLVRRFGVSTSQASADINRYLALGPQGVAYDKSAKRYVAGPAFRPLLVQPDAGRLLGELRLLAAGVLEEGATLLGVAPPFDGGPLPQRRVDPLVLRTLWQALRDGTAVALCYQSMSRPEPLARIVEPHALAHDGYRWHLRAFDRESGAFRDFVLGRIAMAGPAGPRQVAPEQDRDWHERILLRIAPHPGLTPTQTAAIRLDYGIEEEAVELPVRRALCYYALRRLGLDTDPDARPPAQQHIVLLNREEVLREIAGDAVTVRPALD